MILWLYYKCYLCCFGVLNVWMVGLLNLILFIVYNLNLWIVLLFKELIRLNIYYCYSDELIILIIFCVSWISYLGNLRFI